MDVIRPFKFTGDALDMREIICNALAVAPIPVAAGLAYWVHPITPGVQNLYPWAFTLIVAIVVTASLVFVVAVRDRAKLDFGGPHNRDKIIHAAWELHDAGWDLMQIESRENWRQFEKAQNRLFAELSIAGTRYDPWIRPFIVSAADNVQRCLNGAIELTNARAVSRSYCERIVLIVSGV